MPLTILPAILGLVSGAYAASYDPDLTWRTLQTEHFRIHFHQGIEPVAEEVSQMVEGIYETMTEEVGWVPRRPTELVLVDRTDTANGYAITVPYNAIVVYVTAPEEDSTLDTYEDWSETILTHELTHILHIDSNHGLVRLARGSVGKVATTNRLSPRWIVEGYATLEETRHSTGGRGRSALAEMVKRTAVVDDDLPPLGNLSGYQADPPGGNLRYLFGQDFMQYIVERTRDDAWTEWVRRYGASIPYWLPSKKVFGAGFVELHRDWKAQMTLRFETQLAPVTAEGIREGELVSDGVASCIAPAFSPDGEVLVWSCLDRQSGSAIWRSKADGSEAEVLMQDRGATSFTWRADSKAFAYSGTHVVNRFNLFSDVYLHNLESEQTTALTSGARARDPEFSPDGQVLWVVTNKAQNNQLERITVDRRREPLTSHSDHTQLGSPRFAPDGQSAVVSLRRNGRRDLWLLDTEGQPIRRLTADAPAERHPRWSPDGRWLFFSSDRSGIPNIWAIEVATERLYQVTNVRTGATHPAISADGQWLAYQQYSADGWDIRRMALTPEEYLDRGPLPGGVDATPALADLVSPVTPPTSFAGTSNMLEGRPLATTRLPGLDFPTWPRWQVDRQDGERADAFDQPEGLDVFGEEQDFPFTLTPRRYQPLRSLVPRFWLPYVNTTSVPSGKSLGGLAVPNLLFSAASGASDPLRFLSWSAGANFRTDAMAFGGYGALTINRWLPVYSVGVSHGVRPLRLPSVDDPGRLLVYWDRHTIASATVSYPYTFRTQVFARYSFDLFDDFGGIPEGAAVSPLQGRIGELSFGWRYSYSQPTAYAISAEDAQVVSVVFGLLSPWLGTRISVPGLVEPSDLTQARVTAEVRRYLVNPWVDNHVLAVRLASGLAVGQSSAFEDATFLGRYSLGGSFGDGSFAVTPDQFRMLRGYPTGVKSGDMYWLTGLEYRLPLWRFDRGIGTIPVFARALSAVVYADAGNAFSELRSAEDAIAGTLVGVGAELRLSAIYWYNVGLTGRLGYGMGLTEGGYAPGDPRGLYLRLGGSF